MLTFARACAGLSCCPSVQLSSHMQKQPASVSLHQSPGVPMPAPCPQHCCSVLSLSLALPAPSARCQVLMEPVPAPTPAPPCPTVPFSMQGLGLQPPSQGDARGLLGADAGGCGGMPGISTRSLLPPNHPGWAGPSSPCQYLGDVLFSPG